MILVGDNRMGEAEDEQRSEGVTDEVVN